jgi:pimeloyl-ACP methyl ester carboxylesterase
MEVRRKKLKGFRLILAGLLVAASLVTYGGRATASSAHGTCEQLNIPVALSAGQPANQNIVGTLCRPNVPTNSETVDILAPGGTYTTSYWDFPYNYPDYSYVDRTLQAGRATFNFDRIGTGASSKPLSTLVTFDADVYTMHQAIQWLRTNRAFNDVTMVGHSLGSIAAAQEAATYHDVDRLVLTGYLHSASFNALLTIGTNFYPAVLDSQFAGSGLDLGYLTTLPGKRGPAFYSSSADPTVIAYDEAHKDIVSSTEMGTAFSQLILPPPLNSAQNITVPVLTIVGNQDTLCGTASVGVDCSSSATVDAHERPYFSGAPSYTAMVVPDTGHNLPLHPSKAASFASINQWILTH